MNMELNSKFYKDFILNWSLHIYHNEIKTVADFRSYCKKYPHVTKQLKECAHTKYFKDFFEVFDYPGLVDNEALQFALDIFWCGVNREKD